MSASEALEMLCHVRALPLDVIRSPSRKAEHCRLRWWLAQELIAADFNQTEIAEAMGRHPSSIWSGLRGGKGQKKRGHVKSSGPNVLCSCHFRRAR